MKKTLVLSVLLTAILEANAVPVSSTVGDFEVSTVSGPYLTLEAQLESQVWWGSFALASEFAALVNNDLGFFNSTTLDVGPLFAYDDTAGLTLSRVWCEQGFCGAGIVSGYSDGTTNRDRTYAVATRISAVPEPGTLWALGAGLVGLAATRRRHTKTIIDRIQ
jgi:hypothetical protein